ncbi:MAG: GNAT family N-acetyltransferase [Clostridiales bacterium]|jgi:ribosomal protein S18 acetylase RimI-like enzyme|nr:GNAT family N-acetyltransferase [Clostridiales bacterium]
MEIRKTAIDDLDKVMEIYDDARNHMRENGNLNQWINGYPDIELIKKDIINEKSYVCVDGNQIEAVFYFTIGPDPTYLNIYEGDWINDDPYGVVHRIASGNRKKGVASYCLNWCYDKWPNIRIDTHKDNIIMQNFLDKNGFMKCGIIYLEDGAERIAYQKVI